MAKSPRNEAKGNRASAERRQAIVEEAANAFFTHGYAATTMSAIAQSVGGSKTTLWSYFPTKELLFAAVVEDILLRNGKTLLVELPQDRPAREVLRSFGKALMLTLLSTEVLELSRLLAAKSRRFPHLAEMLYERGPRRGKARLAAYLGEQMARGSLRQGDPQIAGEQFVALCRAGIYEFALVGLAPANDEERIDGDIDRAVDTFCRAWGADR